MPVGKDRLSTFMFSPHGLRCLLVVVLLVSTCRLCVAQSKAAPHGVFRTGWGDAMGTAQKFIDSERTFTRAQILQMGYARFTRAWRGGYREVPGIYVEVAGHDSRLRLRKLSDPQRRQIERLRSNVKSLDKSIIDICIDGGDQGTGLLMDALDLEATREEFIHHLLIDESMKLSRTEICSRFLKQMQRLQVVIGRYWHWVNDPKRSPSARWHAHHSANRRRAEQSIRRLTNSSLKLPPERLLKAARLMESRISTLTEVGF